ncbi:MAG: cytidine deaminase [Acetivibrio ethanolgignens]
MENKMLIQQAIKAREFAYTPYSHFKVGAALLGKNGNVYLGCNIENAGYTPSNCAERTAFFKAVSEGVTEFEKIAIVAGKEEIETYTAPCGVCRQVMMEFCKPEEFKVIMAKSPEDYKEMTLAELLPLGFGPADLA